MREPLEELVGSLLYEGYALYPYTPDATKNATPTPFGIVYPPQYAAECAGAFDHARLECLAEPEPDATLTATLRFLSPSGEGHQASEQRIELGPALVGARVTTEFSGGRFTLRSEPLADGGAVVRSCVHNTAEVAAGLDRRRALASAMISTHVVIEIRHGRFVSPLEAGCESVNIWPVLATPQDDAILGAAIVLPDHPQISPASHGNLFDNTEIEEALVLHVHALSDSERAAAAGRDSVVGDMLERALALGPEEIMSLHSGLGPVAAPRDPGHDEEIRGEQRATVDGVTFHRGDTLVLRPGTDRDPYDRMLDGRLATIERIYVDYDDRVHLGVTVNDDPGQELMRETGRYLFFFVHEVEPHE
ncbi:MAG TPA: hypothetical protein VGL51_11415 [Solirubrobacteraceae bacterium]|jgi:hypothetical protein